MLVVDDYIHLDCILKLNTHKARLVPILPTSLHPCHQHPSASHHHRSLGVRQLVDGLQASTLAPFWLILHPVARVSFKSVYQSLLFPYVIPSSYIP